MSNIVLKVENLYKRYRLGTVGAASFGEDLQRLWAKMRGKPDPFEQYITANELSAIKKSADDMKALKARYVWALQDINFEVKQGEILGVIGKNGAGKSTLLKILSKTTAPTRGEVKVKGRVASLLEVGTGFHPELTGRENIFLNGHILGMNRHEIRAHLDEIIDFAGIEAYLDTPVKRYSSGMYVRLGFAVAAHLLADILIVDEVLAVGDAEFQKKCIGKMKDVSSREGRTVLFVSHDINNIANITSKIMLLKNGQIDFLGNTQDGIKKYIASNIKNNNTEYVHSGNLPKHKPTIQRVKLKTTYENNMQLCNDSFEVIIDIYAPLPTKNLCLSFQIIDELGKSIVHSWVFDSDTPFGRTPGTYRLLCSIPKLRLYMGRYHLKVYFSESEGGSMLQIIEHICFFEVVMYKQQRSKFRWQPGACSYLEDFQWNVFILENA